jgi:hypothetical protein
LAEHAWDESVLGLHPLPLGLSYPDKVMKMARESFLTLLVWSDPVIHHHFSSLVWSDLRAGRFNFNPIASASPECSSFERYRTADTAMP